MRVRAVAAALSLGLLAGCTESVSEGSFSTEDGVFATRQVESEDSIQITEKPTKAVYWSGWNVKETRHGMRVALNAVPTKTTGVALPAGQSVSLGALSSQPIKVGDNLRFCAEDAAKDYFFGLTYKGSGGGYSFASLKTCSA